MKDIEKISSIKDARIVHARALQTSRGRAEYNQFLIEGDKQIDWAIKREFPLQQVFVHDKLTDHPLLQGLTVPSYFVSEGILKKITSSSYYVPIVAVAAFPEKIGNPSEIIVVLDNLQDYGNIGTTVRTAQAFGIKDFATIGEHLDLFHKKTIEASRGTVFSSTNRSFKSAHDAIENLKDYQIVVTTPYASTDQGFCKPEDKPMAIVFGNETSGVCQELLDAADLKIQIPMLNDVESLNVGVAAGISLYEMKIKLVMAMMTKKIQGSLGRDLSSASFALRSVFNKKLSKSSPLTAEEAILLMVLRCDVCSTKDQLLHDAGVMSPHLDSLVKKGYIIDHHGKYSLSTAGEEIIAKIWYLHEETEEIACKGISQEEMDTFLLVLSKITSNCLLLDDKTDGAKEGDL